MAGNPRIDELRKRLEKEPGSRLFAQLAEELRKDGDLEEAIRISREGLHKHPNYPSARITLGRALFDSGDLAGASAEFSHVLKTAPDNIVASRMLAECLEGLGDFRGAWEQYKATLVLAPGDRQIAARLQTLEARAAPRRAVTLRPPPAPPRGAQPEPGMKSHVPPQPIPGVAEEMAFEVEAELAPRPPAPAEDLAPIPLVEAEESFELERSYEAPAPVSVASTPSAAKEPVARQPEIEVPGEFEFERTPLESAAPESFEVIPEPAPAAGPATPGAELASPTLAELYFQQGLVDQAVRVYGELVRREPGNVRLQARLEELSAMEREQGGAEAAAPRQGDRAARRAALERTIGRLEGLLVAVRRR